MIISASNYIKLTISILSKAFQAIDLGNMTNFFGINIFQQQDGIRIYQSDKIEDLYNSLGMLLCMGANIPIVWW